MSDHVTQEQFMAQTARIAALENEISQDAGLFGRNLGRVERELKKKVRELELRLDVHVAKLAELDERDPWRHPAPSVPWNWKMVHDIGYEAGWEARMRAGWKEAAEKKPKVSPGITPYHCNNCGWQGNEPYRDNRYHRPGPFCPDCGEDVVER